MRPAAARRLKSAALRDGCQRSRSKRVILSWTQVTSRRRSSVSRCSTSAGLSGSELPSIEAIKKFVAAGNGVALLPLITVEEEIARGDLVHVAVPELRFERKSRIMHRRNVVLSHAARAFLAIARAFARGRTERFVFHAER